MDAMASFMGEANRRNTQRVFDWNKAAEIIRDRKPEQACAGLREDWGWTSGPIWSDGKPVDEDDTYTYLASTWATPTLLLDDSDDVECWRYGTEVADWDSKTYWPESAKTIAGVKF